MIIISLSQDLEDNPNLIIIDCINHLAIFFLPANWESASTGQSLSPIQSLPMCSTCSPMEKKIPWLWGMWEHGTCMFEGGNLLSLNLTPVTNTPWKHCNLTSCVTQPQSHLCQCQSDLFIILFLRKLCNLHLPTTICILCVHKKKQTCKVPNESIRIKF